MYLSPNSGSMFWVELNLKYFEILRCARGHVGGIEVWKNCSKSWLNAIFAVSCWTTWRYGKIYWVVVDEEVTWFYSLVLQKIDTVAGLRVWLMWWSFEKCLRNVWYIVIYSWIFRFALLLQFLTSILFFCLNYSLRYMRWHSDLGRIMGKNIILFICIQQHW